MQCEQAVPRLQSLADGELGRIARFRAMRHVAGCAACTRRLAALQSLQSAVRGGLSRHRAPPALAARIGAAIAQEPPLPVAPRRAARRVSLGFATSGLATSGLAGALAGVALTLLVTRLPTASPTAATDEAARAVVESHVRSLLPGHLTEVETSDRHTVKPWLSSRLDVSPVVKDLTESGFPLIGGRLDYVAGHRVGCVVYRRDRHIINLLVWASPGAPDQGFATSQRQGFNLVTWRRDGTTLWAISDLERSELETFARRIAGDT